MYAVCTDIYKPYLVVASFNTEEEAEEFAKVPAVLAYSDELENGEEDVVIYPEQMWIEEVMDDDIMPF